MSASTPSPTQGDHPLRWGIVSLLVAATVINYIDRQSVAVLAPILQKELDLTNAQYARAATWFLGFYAGSMWLWGAVFDRLGNRKGFALAICGWSLAAMAHAFAVGRSSLYAFRAALGLGEAGNWPGATRTVAAWFNPRQRALAMGIVNCGAAGGSAIAVPLLVWMQITWGWQATFLVTGSLGFLWLAVWLVVYPSREPASGPEGDTAITAPAAPIPWKVLLKRREVWGIIMARFFGDPIWWLYLFWLPLYLTQARGFNLKEIGLFAWVPFVAADAGCLAGGWTSGVLIKRGWSVNAARKTAILVGTFLMPAGIVAAYSQSPYAALGWISVTLFGFQYWVGNIQTLPSDFFPVRAVGSIAGFAGTAAGLGAIIFTECTGWVTMRFSYTPILIAAGLLAPAATGALFLLIGRIRPLEAVKP